jgi:exoribonuclease R
MPSLARTPVARDAEIVAGFARARTEVGVPERFPDGVEREAAERALAGPRLPPGAPAEPVDQRDTPFVTIDPPGSRDLDQAYFAERRADGYRVHYAIADVAAFVTPGEAVDVEARERGVTLYSPDGHAPLHPLSLSEDAASLLPGEDRWAAAWVIDLDGGGEIVHAHVKRAVVRSRAMLTYGEAQTAIEAGDDGALGLLAEVGRLRHEREAERGGVSLQRASQEIVRGDDGWQLVFDTALPVEDWNAQISLLTGIAAARIMLEGDIGVLRTLPVPDEHTIAGLRRQAAALGIPWPEEVSYPDFARGLTADSPARVAMISQAARGLRGAGYEAFDGAPPEEPGHAAIAASYAHVTAPLRRLVDRFANEVLIALCAEAEPSDWVRDALPELPRLMNQARSRDRALERAALDYLEAMLLASRVGESFPATVVDIDDDTDHARIQLSDPAVVARMPGGGVSLGERVTVRLTRVDPERRSVEFTPT